MHTRKKQAFAGFIISCMLSVAFGAVTILRPNVVSIGFLVVFLAISCFGGYRVFAFSDDWYRAREEKEHMWYERHPHLTSSLTVFVTGCFLWQVFGIIRRLFR